MPRRLPSICSAITVAMNCLYVQHQALKCAQNAANHLIIPIFIIILYFTILDFWSPLSIRAEYTCSCTLHVCKCANHMQWATCVHAGNHDIPNRFHFIRTFTYYFRARRCADKYDAWYTVDGAPANCTVHTYTYCSIDGRRCRRFMCARARPPIKSAKVEMAREI